MDEDEDSDGSGSGAMIRSADRQQSTWSLLVSALLYAPSLPAAPQADGSALGGPADWQASDINASRPIPIPFGADQSLLGSPDLHGSWLLGSPAGLGTQQEPVQPNWPNIILAFILVMLMLTTAIGNLFVIVAILIERNLRTIGNYLVLSLAIADLLVALLVMPLASIYQILERWTLGVLLCDIWTAADVFCCTASILHLLAIALDRYWAVTRVDYIRCQRNERRILYMIFFVWITASVISLAPIFGWKDAQFEERITIEQECLLSQDIGYQIFATCTTFYFPSTLTLIFYWKIYQVARKRIRRKPGNRIKISLHRPSSSSSSSSPGRKLQLAEHQQQELKQAQAPSCTGNDKKTDLKCPCSCHRSLQRGPPIEPEYHRANGSDSYMVRGKGCLSNAAGSASSLSSNRLMAPSDSSQSALDDPQPALINGDNICLARGQASNHAMTAYGRQLALATDNQISVGSFDELAKQQRQSANLSGQTLAKAGTLAGNSGELGQVPKKQDSPLQAYSINLPSDRIKVEPALQVGHGKSALARPDALSEAITSDIPNRKQVDSGAEALSSRQVLLGATNESRPALTGPRRHLVKMYFSEGGQSINRGLKSLFGAHQSSVVAMLGNMDPESPSIQQPPPASPSSFSDQQKSVWPDLVDQSGCSMCSCGPLLADAPNGGPVIQSGDQADKRTTLRLSRPHPQLAAPTLASSAQAVAEGLESKRERKAAKTLAIITGVFVMCWLPFFVMAITMPLLELRPHKYVFAFLLWLGYVNSMLNPIIYTIFSPDFRKAFKRLLCSIDVLNRTHADSGASGTNLHPRRAQAVGANQPRSTYLVVDSEPSSPCCNWLAPIMSKCGKLGQNSAAGSMPASLLGPTSQAQAYQDARPAILMTGRDAAISSQRIPAKVLGNHSPRSPAAVINDF